jgi:hypothetical protein
MAALSGCRTSVAAIWLVARVAVTKPVPVTPASVCTSTSWMSPA